MASLESLQGEQHHKNRNEYSEANGDDDIGNERARTSKKREFTGITNDKTMLSILGQLLVPMTCIMNGICSMLVLIFMCSNPNTQEKFLSPP